MDVMAPRAAVSHSHYFGLTSEAIVAAATKLAL
jgi:hypothetical protein